MASDGQIIREISSGYLTVQVRRVQAAPPRFTLTIGYRKGRRFSSQIPAASGYAERLASLISNAQASVLDDLVAWEQTKTNGRRAKP